MIRGKRKLTCFKNNSTKNKVIVESSKIEEKILK